MKDTTGSDKIFWEEFWLHPDGKENREAASIKMVPLLERVCDFSNIKSVGDYGCGSAPTLFKLAAKYSGCQFHGYDISERVIEENRKIVADERLSNLSFHVDQLPALRCTRPHDLVLSIATLHYVLDIEEAIAALFARVRPGGMVIFNYPNIQTRTWYMKSKSMKSPQLQKRFFLVLEGKNLTSMRAIHKITGRRPKNFWIASGKEPKQGNSCVYLRK